MSIKIHELGHVVLYVSSLTRSANFYRDTLGFREIACDRHTALYSSGRTHHELLLIEIGQVSEEPERSPELVEGQSRRPRPGLYHIGFKIGDTDEELRVALEDLKKAGIRIIGTADHTVTHSLYIEDPDGNELELYVDISDEWRANPSSILSPTRRLEL